MPQRKTLFGRDRDLFLGSRLNLGPQPAKLVEPGGVVQTVSQAERVADLAGQLTHLLVDLQCLVGVAEVPEGHRQIAADVDAGVVARLRGPELDALRVVELGESPSRSGRGLRRNPPDRASSGRPCRTLPSWRRDRRRGLANSIASATSSVQSPELAADEMPLPDAHDDRDELR